MWKMALECVESHILGLSPTLSRRRSATMEFQFRERAMMLLERQPQLQQMDALLADAIGGRGRIVVVLGEAGAGKTALVE
ncbi:AAA family ATPase, partial [Mesorhizobium sp.]|uniref:ATP-binding protein n=1 Tax=Mesorhizobium sp. TaxID=1871066 RepID=UPI0032AF788E